VGLFAIFLTKHPMGQEGIVEIWITTGTGEGPNALVAFDLALYEAGIANFNLIQLSSVIPSGSTICQKQLHLNDHDWGAKLYLVLAQHRAVEVGTQSWAAIGWVQEESTGKGLFVEHGGATRNEVERLVEESLSSMVSYRPGSFGPPQTVATGVMCRDLAVCAVVAAVFQVVPWNLTNGKKRDSHFALDAPLSG
jgi:arginine decarboxylase